MPSASVILLTYNGARYLQEVLDAVRAQQPGPFEVLAIDSGSSDGSVAILRAAGVRLHEIDKSAFSHSATRNLAARMAGGTHAVFLTQDATPADERWLERLLEPLARDPRVAGAYSRQVARADAEIAEARDLRLGFPEEPRVKAHPGDDASLRASVWDLMHFSDSSAAYDLALLRAHPFDERLGMGEDQEWALRMIEHGRAIAYAPGSVVLHSHDRGLRSQYARSYEMGAAFGTFLGPRLGRRRFPTAAWALDVLGDAWFAVKADAGLAARARAIARAPLDRFVRHWAYARGWRQALRQSGAASGGPAGRPE